MEDREYGGCSMFLNIIIPSSEQLARRVLSNGICCDGLLEKKKILMKCVAYRCRTRMIMVDGTFHRVRSTA